LRAQTRSKLQRRRASGKILEQRFEISLKHRVSFRERVSALKFAERHHQCFGNVPATIGPEAARNRCRNSQSGAHGNYYCRITRQKRDITPGAAAMRADLLPAPVDADVASFTAVGANDMLGDAHRIAAG